MLKKIKSMIDLTNLEYWLIEIKKSANTDDANKKEKILQRFNKAYQKSANYIEGYRGDMKNVIPEFNLFVNYTMLAVQMFTQEGNVEGAKSVIDYLYEKAALMEENPDTKKIVKSLYNIVDSVKYANLLKFAVTVEDNPDKDRQLEEVGVYLYQQIQKPTPTIVASMAMYQYFTSGTKRASEYSKMYEEIAKKALPQLSNQTANSKIEAYNEFLRTNKKPKLTP